MPAALVVAVAPAVALKVQAMQRMDAFQAPFDDFEDKESQLISESDEMFQKQFARKPRRL